MDIWMVYEAFLSNDHLAQEYFDHPGYLTILLLGEWLRLLHSCGLLAVDRLSQLPPVADIAGSALAWTRATQAGRLLSLLFGIGFVTSFTVLLRRSIGNWRVAALAAFMLAFSGGLMMEARIIRTELVSAGFAYGALLILLIAAQRTDGMRPLLVGIAAFFATGAMLNKVQFIFLIMTFPPIVYLLADKPTSVAPVWRSGGTRIVLLMGFVAAALLATIVAWPVLWSGLGDLGAVAERTRVLGTGVPWYQIFIGFWVVAWMVAFKIKCRLGAAETAAAMASVVTGVALGLLLLLIRYASRNAVVVANPLEQMIGFVAADRTSGGLSTVTLVRELAGGVGLLAKRQTFFLDASARPTVFLEWAVFAGAVFAWRQGRRRTVYEVALLIVAAWAVDLVGTFRWLKLEYFIITDPLVILAAGWLLVRVPELQGHRLTYPLGAVLMVTTVAVGSAEPIKHSFKTDLPLDFCVAHYHYTRQIERFSFCPD
jgi:hypothetical protein